MSWSCSGSFRKQDADAGVAALAPTGELDGPMTDQLVVARNAARELLMTIPGPMVHVSLSGHANGVGWHAKPGWANDCITVYVTQGVDQETGDKT